MTDGAGTGLPCARGGAKGQAVVGSGPRRQIGVPLGRPGAPTRTEQPLAPGPVRGAGGQHRSDGRRREGQTSVRTASKNATMLGRSSREVSFPSPDNGVLVGMAYGEAAPGSSGSPHLPTNSRKP